MVHVCEPVNIYLGLALKTIGDRLKEERGRMKRNQTDFAALAGVGKTTQINYESGTRSPDAEYLAAIALAGADVLYVLTGRYSDSEVAEDVAVDWQLLEQIIAGVEEFLSERKLKLRSDRKAGLIRVLYSKFSEEDNLDKARFKDFMDAVMATV
jgi:transcriptional regulator with XRE-family HTH domain